MMVRAPVALVLHMDEMWRLSGSLVSAATFSNFSLQQNQNYSVFTEEDVFIFLTWLKCISGENISSIFDSEFLTVSE